MAILVSDSDLAAFMRRHAGREFAHTTRCWTGPGVEPIPHHRIALAYTWGELKGVLEQYGVNVDPLRDKDAAKA